MKNKSIIAYFTILIILCAGFVIGARTMGERGVYLAGGYMLTPAIAALVTRLVFHAPRFKDAHLRFGRFSDYVKFWLYSLGITAFSFALFTLSGSVRWDFSGRIFLDMLAQQVSATGEDMLATLPPGFTPQMMLWLFVIGGLTVFNIMPGIVSGFGEEFGHRGFMFPFLSPDKPWLGLLLGGLIWYLWHQPLALVFPVPAPIPVWQTIINHLAAIIGAICTHTYLCYVYARSKSIFVPSIAHIAMNNATRSLAYFVVIENQFTANLMQYIVMIFVIALLYQQNDLKVILEFLSEPNDRA
ncbi:MAG: CPBP family intramembrane metalloprotease [Chloroflexi bacterium CFX2]|nr:CPBP family intramembrane metalloprotease [Chloroflexi bacterium CFX2]